MVADSLVAEYSDSRRLDKRAEFGLQRCWIYKLQCLVLNICPPKRFFVSLCLSKKVDVIIL